MILIQIVVMALVVFLSRYLFLEPRVPLRLGPRLHRLLSYSGPAVLTVIWAPIVFMPNQSLWIDWQNPYIWAALLAGMIAWKTRNVLLTTVLSMMVFLLLHLVVFSH
ncbi:AzlD domain-containing protein [Vibrio mangrovi]|uniref:AzlD domain-containing protein n=1 Tax=Vibrio mangrovi TaxID=474394 RepID=A0A1Y6IVZ5_9VIBR|nr:AzlD domain-containing protein [Vibrio mangrovi]MDW6005066.1 AzlD domain-containing protein [Vibrio mangrovi]SMS01834.1 Branched-chain amino acid transport protein (AzlD) [Vibrio mangrovi]